MTNIYVNSLRTLPIYIKSNVRTRLLNTTLYTHYIFLKELRYNNYWVWLDFGF